MRYLAPSAGITETAFGNETMDMRVPFQIAAECVQDTDKTGGKGFGFIHIVEQVQKSGTDSRKEQIQQIAVF